jgi:hypothetical protein
MMNRFAFVLVLLFNYACNGGAEFVQATSVVSWTSSSLHRFRKQQRQQQLHNAWMIKACRGGGEGTRERKINPLQKWNVYFDDAASKDASTTDDNDTNDESIYDRYAACLAATEGLRRRRDQSVRRGDNDAEAQYIRDASKILSALGMTVEQYNQIGAKLLRKEQDSNIQELKQKVRRSKVWFLT